MSDGGAERPVVVPEFGDFLKRCRDHVGLTQGQVEQRVKERFGFPLGHAVLWRYEAGQTSAPDPAILWCLSRIYRVGLDQIVTCLVRERATKPLAQSDLEPMHVTDRSAGLSPEAMSAARSFDILQEPIRAIVLTMLRMFERVEAAKTDAQRPPARTNNTHNG